MKLTRSALVAAAAAAALVALPATAASAQTVLHLDQTHDVRSQSMDSDTVTREPKVAEGDVQAIAIDHARHNVIVTVKYRELTRTGTLSGHGFLFRTNTGERRMVTITAEKGSWWGHQELATPQGDAVPCSGMSHTIDYVKNKITLVVPRFCLGRPRWVQVGEGTARFEDTSESTTSGDTTTPGSATVFEDDAFSPYVSSDLHWSPRVHRG